MMSTSSLKTALYSLQRRDWGYLGEFRAMASPCEILIACDQLDIADDMLDMAVTEALRIEHKYSRFIAQNCLWQLNHANGHKQLIDEETWQLLAFAKQCFQLSDGLFDISAGPLMELWRFDPKAQLPEHARILAAKALVGFDRIEFDSRHIEMPTGMKLDFGGVAKEYAVDRVAYELAECYPDIPVLVNFGGDIACPVPKEYPWQVGIEDPQHLDHAANVLAISQGALATSGDTRRFFEVDGKRYGHIVDPRTGYPVVQAPRSVTVLGPNCVTAGMLATMAMLQGQDAEDFLQQQDVKFSIFR
ncbi:MAG: FAD:protein FMN transferase [Gammaproteobacteria bacterium]|nr:FAD:protein FMN transferase [Gammaproteobacteria bacterium]MBU1476044.1 FAD:protein FMN transferase [Gammaproteobacteria bacterium]MBU2001867.1 FAD:protein FMN transferase [Gammaproteobacteria bacterium]MBU2132351.1 FAD:protein FMN transferase [Gammaproteobacteria bacterium]MBU2186441.1 FAD:protein FMN transferase [Gammaproteobacteria bacterium]